MSSARSYDQPSEFSRCMPARSGVISDWFYASKAWSFFEQCYPLLIFLKSSRVMTRKEWAPSLVWLMVSRPLELCNLLSIVSRSHNGPVWYCMTLLELPCLTSKFILISHLLDTLAVFWISVSNLRCFLVAIYFCWRWPSFSLCCWSIFYKNLIMIFMIC